MKKVKVKVREKRKNGQPCEWEEVHEIPDGKDPETYVRETIDIFNTTRGAKYEFVKIVRTRRGELKQTHDWKKHSLVIQKGGYDIYRCAICGATGKRYGLQANVVADKKFDPKYCQ